MGKGSGFI